VLSQSGTSHRYAKFRLNTTIARDRTGWRWYLQVVTRQRINGWVGTRDDERAKTRARIEELRKRTEELETRNRELVGQDLLAGSSEENVERAQRRAAQARTRAVEAHKRATRAYLRSAEAHDAAAARYEELASGGYGDVGEHMRRAREHREMSAADRRATEARQATPREVWRG
jgi:hypothetical protein